MTRLIGTFSFDRLGDLETVLSRAGYKFPVASVDDWDEDVLPRVQQFSAQCEKAIEQARAAYSIVTEIPYAILMSADANAAAVRVGNQFAIIVLLGTFLRLSNLFRRLVTVDQFYAAISKVETPCAPARGDPIDLVASAADIPADREELANILFQISLRFLMFHEVGHIKNGHLMLSKPNKTISVLLEAVSIGLESDEALTRHTLEMDADAFASGHSFGEIFSLSTNDLPERLRWTFSSDRRRAMLLALSICALFRAFDRATKSQAPLLSRSHPPGSVRMLSLGAWGIEYFRQPPAADRLSIAEWTPIVPEAVSLIESSLSVLTEQPEEKEWLLKSLDQEEYVHERLARWAKIRSDLEPYLLGGSLASTSADPA